MSQIILDFGSGNTCKNDLKYAFNMIDALKVVDTGKHEVIIKWQLFQQAGNNIPLNFYLFEKVYHYAAEQGYKTTASVFDRHCLLFLLSFDVPFVKIANNRELDYLIGEVPRKIPVYVSKNSKTKFRTRPDGTNTWLNPMSFIGLKILHCISEYPADLSSYLNDDYDTSYDGISDHTTNWDLYNKYKPEIYECHFKLAFSEGLDAGEFARTPDMLREIL